MKKVLIADDVLGWQKFHAGAVIKVLGDNTYIDMVSSATEAYEKILENINSPYDFVLTDMQMEDDYSPKYAGEWLIEQIGTLSGYYKTKIIIISATYNIRKIAESYGVDCIPKSTAATCLSAYEELLK